MDSPKGYRVKMCNSDENIIYRSRTSRKIISYILMPEVSVIGICFGLILVKGSKISLGIIFILFGIGMVFLSIFSFLMCSSIVVGSQGIAARNFGRTFKFIRWQDITVIKKIRKRKAGTHSYEGIFEDVYYVFDGTFSMLERWMVNLRGPIAFGDQILGLRTLLDKINEAARQYHFALIVADEEAARKFAVQNRERIWRRFVPKVEEVPVKDF